MRLESTFLTSVPVSTVSPIRCVSHQNRITGIGWHRYSVLFGTDPELGPISLIETSAIKTPVKDDLRRCTNLIVDFAF
jgi:hypothetical protein